MRERDLEEPPEDVAEQSRSALDDDDDQGADQKREMPLDVNEADAAEQSKDVGLDDDEYR